jgi:hypothetical protein
MNLEAMKPGREEFFEHALRHAGRPPFVRPRQPRLTRAPRQHQENFYPVVVELPDLTKRDR